MKETFRQIAIIGSTASGKSSLAIGIAKEIDAVVLSLDSLSIYREIDIASAKPTLQERDGVLHFGIDMLYPNEKFDVTLFVKLYNRVYHYAKKLDKNLIIVGGTSFYLKILIDGISPLPEINKAVGLEVQKAMADRRQAYEMLSRLDPEYMNGINENDSYRIEKALTILYSSNQIPTVYFKNNQPKSLLKKRVDIYQIDTDRDRILRLITLRTKEMLEKGLIDEIAYLEKRYTRSPNCMKSIGIKETLAYLDGIYSKSQLEEKIITNTARLAKRQRTFNSSQFDNVVKMDLNSLKKKILNNYEKRD